MRQTIQYFDPKILKRSREEQRFAVVLTKFSDTIFLPALSLVLCWSCSSGFRSSSDQPVDGSNNLFSNSSGLTLKNVFDELPKNEKSLDLICAKSGSDRFRQAFCRANKPSIKGIRDLYGALGIVVSDQKYACTSHSVSLVRNDVGVLNPRCISFTSNQADEAAAAVGFQRSELTLVEVVAKDPQTEELSFYLIDYDLPCEKSPEGCQSGDYYLEGSESGWSNLSFYEDVSLKNTVFDCTTCHQPGGSQSGKSLRMAEASLPWTHWLSVKTDCGKSLHGEFLAAHGEESFYAGIPITMLSKAIDPLNLELFVNNNGYTGRSHGNDYFNSFQIELEQADDPNSISSSWQQEYENRNRFLGLDNFGGVSMPYYGCKQSDPTRLSSFTQSYQAAREGTASPSSLPFLHSVNLDSEKDLRDRGLMAMDNLSDEQLFARACLACHHSGLDQTISRAKFNAERVNLNSLESLNKGITRLTMVEDDLQKMPPPMFLKLNSKETLRLINYLESVKRK